MEMNIFPFRYLIKFKLNSFEHIEVVCQVYVTSPEWMMI